MSSPFLNITGKFYSYGYGIVSLFQSFGYLLPLNIIFIGLTDDLNTELSSGIAPVT